MAKRVLVIGDPVIDVYQIAGSCEASGEGPYLKLSNCVEYARPGGAARVAWALAELGCDVVAGFGSLGNGGRGSGQALGEAFSMMAVGTARSRIHIWDGPRSVYRPGPDRKVRVVCDGRVLLRYDEPTQTQGISGNHILSEAQQALDKYCPDAVVFSDYGRGMFSVPFDESWVQFAVYVKTMSNLPVFAAIRPKNIQPWIDHNAAVLVMNEKEFWQFHGGEPRLDVSDETNPERQRLDLMSRVLMRTVDRRGGLVNLVVTAGDKGAYWYGPPYAPVTGLASNGLNTNTLNHSPVEGDRYEGLNTIGAGDVFLAAITRRFLEDGNYEKAVTAAVAVASRSTHRPSHLEGINPFDRFVSEVS